MKEVNLPSGAVIRIDEAPFEDALELNDIFLEELRSVNFSVKNEIGSMLAAAVLAVAPSKKFRAAVLKCMERCLYDGATMNKEFWKAGKIKREDFYSACHSVSEENLRPFENDLYSLYVSIVSKFASPQE